MDHIFASLNIQILQIYKNWFSWNAVKKKVLQDKRSMVEKQRKRNRAILALLLRRRQRRMFERSYWVQSELILREHGKFWEMAVPQYTGK